MLVSRKGQAAAAYEAQDVLGRGSFGTVYLGEDVHEPGRRVALKSILSRNITSGSTVLAAAGESTSDAWEKAMLEAEVLQRLEHPNILRCHEWFEDGDTSSGPRLWIVLELMDGSDLQTFYTSRRRALAGPADPVLVRRVISSVGSALEYLHRMDILHRDVKCANVLFTQSFEKFVLADFGLACTTQEATKENLEALGTPTYLSPEVLCGRPHSPSSDAWSLGVCAFKLAALQKPFEARDDVGLAMKIMKGTPKELPRSCPADIACAVRGLLTKPQGKRLHAAGAVELTNTASIARLSQLAARAARKAPRQLSAL